MQDWYNTNLITYDGYLADVVWCNDMTISSGTGMGTSSTTYMGYKRIRSEKRPSLNCPNNSKYFKSDTGIKAGLLTADEAVLRDF